MTLQEKIQNDLKTSMLNKDVVKRDLIRVLIGEINRIGKEVDDDSIIKIIRKMVENATLMNNQDEVTILSEYLPKMMGKDEIENIIRDIMNTNGYNNIKQMGLIIKELKEKYGSLIDGKIASDIIKTILT